MAKAEADSKPRVTRTFEKAQFTGAQRADHRGRWALLLLILIFLGVVYWVARDVLYTRLIYGFAQRTFNDLASAAVEKIGAARIDEQGDLVLTNAEAYTHRKGVRRLFFRTRELRLTLDGTPLRDSRLHVMRVDLFHPEIWVRREPGGDWNIFWACVKAPRPPGEPEPPDPRDALWKDYAKPDESFPRNGVFIHDGILHVTFVMKSGKEVTWDITGVQATMRKKNGIIVLDPAFGNFYGGRIKGYGEIEKTQPFTLSQMTIDIKDADVAQMAAGAPFVKYPVSGKFNAVVAVTYDKERVGRRPISAGHAEITEGNLWEFPVFAGILNILTLTDVSERRIDTAILEFTVEEDHVRIDKMYFLGFPVSLFGDGTCSLGGDWMEIVFVPRLGKSDWNSILPIIGVPIQWLADLFKGALLPVVLTGSFWKPEVAVRPGYFLQPSVRKLMEEKAPK